MARIHIALNVSDLDHAIRFYETLFGVSPLRRIDDYAQFLVEDPALNLALTEHHDEDAPGGHFGIEVVDVSSVAAAMTRLESKGLSPKIESDSFCCHARQEKFWVYDPDGHRWEIFWVRERFMTPSNASNSTCCHV